MRFGDDIAEDAKSALDAFGVDVAVSDEAYGARSGVERPDAVGLERVAKLDRVEAGLLAIEDDDVGLHFGRIDLKARYFSDAFR